MNKTLFSYLLFSCFFGQSVFSAITVSFSYAVSLADGTDSLDLDGETISFLGTIPDSATYISVGGETAAPLTSMEMSISGGMNVGTYTLSVTGGDFVIVTDLSMLGSTWLIGNPLSLPDSQPLMFGNLNFTPSFGGDSLTQSAGDLVEASDLDGVTLLQSAVLDADDGSNIYALFPIGVTSAVPELSMSAKLTGCVALFFVLARRQNRR